MTKIIMFGCNGHMGEMITQIAAKDDQVLLVAGVDIDTKKKRPYPVFRRISECDIAADVVIDFSGASGLEARVDDAIQKNLALVECSTGFSDEQIKYLSDAGKKIAVLRSANMSLGINLLLKLVREAADKLSVEGFDAEIVEKHHNQKLDAPSGTALALADAIGGAFETEPEYVFDRSQKKEKRDKAQIGISSVRGGNIVGEHEVIFAGTDEVITFTHMATSKAVFAKGAITAAKFLCGKAPGLYQMSDVLK